MKTIKLRGRVKRGLRIASGSNPDPNLKLNNTIFLQKPFFLKARIPGMKNIHNGTVNLSIHPNEFKILKPDHEVTCEWVRGVTETFWFVAAKAEFDGNTYDGYIYYPCPSKVKSHDDNIVELLLPKINGVKYGDSITAHVSSDKIQLV